MTIQLPTFTVYKQGIYVTISFDRCIQAQRGFSELCLPLRLRQSAQVLVSTRTRIANTTLSHFRLPKRPLLSRDTQRDALSTYKHTNMKTHTHTWQRQSARDSQRDKVPKYVRINASALDDMWKTCFYALIWGEMKLIYPSMLLYQASSKRCGIGALGSSSFVQKYGINQTHKKEDYILERSEPSGSFEALLRRWTMCDPAGVAQESLPT